MAYKRIEGKGLRTTYDDAPKLTFITESNAAIHLEIEFTSAPSSWTNVSRKGDEVTLGETVRAESEQKKTRIRFEAVIDFRLVSDSCDYLDSNPDDYEFALIEILDSDRIRRLAESPIGDRLKGEDDVQPGGIRVAELRHFRIGFDEFGTLDVVCLGLSIEHIEVPIPDSSSG